MGAEPQTVKYTEEDSGEIYEKSALLGDVNDDGLINAADARLILRHAVRLTGEGRFLLEAADVDGDGIVRSSDARNVLRYAVKLDLDLKGTPAPTRPRPTTTAAPTTTQPPTTKRDPLSYKIAMIGDSLVATLAMYDDTGRIDFYGKVSLNVYSMFNKKISGSDRFVIDEIKDRGYEIVIILIGINEVSYGDTAWGNQYREVIDAVKQRAPGARVICHGLPPISKGASQRNTYGLNMEALTARNKLIKSIAEEKGCEYFDAGPVLRNGNSYYLPDEAASDGIHPGNYYSDMWIDWILKELFK